MGMSSTGVLRSVAEWLDGTYDRRDRVARGLRKGVPTAVRFALRGTGYERTSYERRRTEIDVHMPSGYPLSLHVRRHEWTDLHQIERSAMVDVQIGDAAFERAFLIEAAPARIARLLLDTSVRRLLASYDAAVLTNEQRDGKPVLRLSVPSWLGNEAITVAVDVLVAVAKALRDAYAAVEATALRDAGSPYRPQLDDAQVDAQRSELAKEVELVEALRAKR
jgi:hypothetical protein